jgi:hypothetical protein
MYEEDYDIDRLLEDMGKTEKEVKFVVCDNKKLTLDAFKNKLNDFTKLDYSDSRYDPLYKAIIAGDDWWLEYNCVCCNGPSWYYREHPKKKWL